MLRLVGIWLFDGVPRFDMELDASSNPRFPRSGRWDFVGVCYGSLCISGCGTCYGVIVWEEWCILLCRYTYIHAHRTMASRSLDQAASQSNTITINQLSCTSGWWKGKRSNKLEVGRNSFAARLRRTDSKFTNNPLGSTWELPFDLCTNFICQSSLLEHKHAAVRGNLRLLRNPALHFTIHAQASLAWAAKHHYLHEHF